jgi:prepilin-type N-terminal cleavage/methylation domain-containing protein
VRGFSLIELMLASAIFAVAAAVAFVLYGAMTKSYREGENDTDRQQTTRVAFGRVISDVRLAGFNTHPDGDAGRTDEQIEGMWDTAITIRGDFDVEDPVASTTPESSLAGPDEDVVSTGNDEIVTYVLAGPGQAGADSLTLRLDPDRPRSGAVKTVTIPNIVLVQGAPPYTLYRVTLADVNGAFPPSPQASSSFVYEPVADHIRSMTFQYYDDGGHLLNPDTPDIASDDIAGSDAGIPVRARVRRVAVRIVGMSPDDGLEGADPADETAAAHHRNFDLRSNVSPENLGKRGIADVDLVRAPNPATVPALP